MFNNKEIEKLKAENENYQSQLKVKSIECQQLHEQYVHKNNELFDVISLAFEGFRKIVDISERNDYGNQSQKISKIEEEAKELKIYFAQLTINTDLMKKNRTIQTDQSTK